MSDKPWAHLPNARHIDAVVDGTFSGDLDWNVPLDRAIDRQRLAAWDAVIQEAEKACTLWVLGATRTRLETSLTARFKKASPWAAVTDATDTLIAWDDSATLLECTPDVLRAMIDLAEPPVCHQAALLLPYAIVKTIED